MVTRINTNTNPENINMEALQMEALQRTMVKEIESVVNYNVIISILTVLSLIENGNLIKYFKETLEAQLQIIKNNWEVKDEKLKIFQKEIPQVIDEMAKPYMNIADIITNQVKSNG